MEGSDGGWLRGMTMAESRQRDLRAHRQGHIGSKMEGWDLFEAEGQVEDGVWRRRWCVYPVDVRDHEHEDGIWFYNDVVAAKVRDWKMAREKVRPRAVTRTLVRAWRALPWR